MQSRKKLHMTENYSRGFSQREEIHKIPAAELAKTISTRGQNSYLPATVSVLSSISK